MFYYKKIENNEVTEIGTHSLIVPNYAIEITEEEYNTLLAEFEAKWKAEAEKNPDANIKDYQAALTELGVNVSEES